MLRKIVQTALMVILFVSVVGIGLHALNREAHAQVAYLVRMMDYVDLDEYEIIEGEEIYVEINLFINEVWVGWTEADYMGDGWFKLVKPALNEWVPWQVRYSLNELPPCNPDENPCDGPDEEFSFAWILGGNWR